MKSAVAALLLVPLAACATGPEPKAELDPREAKELAAALDGKVAGKPVDCVSILSGTNLHAVGDHTLLYRVNRHLVYRNDLRGTCHGLGRGDVLVLHVYGSQYCRGDLAHAVDPFSGIMGGTCMLGDFVPYKTAEGG